ncbi:MAG TPA: SigE family RNA polymerase sigma factor [Mycobacteriales bacterium]|jgi:RNA polymerase sigma-70 factor (sigma-E family)|nr:SigE family RNA polymerase sigma factor [Mycobacteriales bacterium]
MSQADESAFRTFAVSRRPALRRTAYLMCGDWHQADDLVQTALTKLFVAWKRVRSDEQPDAYARRILTRCYLDERRRPWRRESPVEVLHDAPTATRSTEDALDLRVALDRLPARQRATLVLRFWADASVTETADALGCSEGTVKSQTARALSTLRALLGDPVLLEELS